MFSWFISLLMLFGYQSKTANVLSVSHGDSGNTHVIHADGTQGSGGTTGTDGTGQGGGG
jgi:hypothetical protein